MYRKIAMITLFPVFLFISYLLTMATGPHKNIQINQRAITPTPNPTQIAQIRGPQDRFTENTTELASNTPVRGVAGDLWADVIIGQPRFEQITPNQVVSNRVFNPGGVFVDRYHIPNRVYVYDAGNSRILGFSSLGSCAAGANAGLACTSTSDCPGSACTINSTKPADIIIGQSSPDESMCNGDSSFQSYPAFPAPSAGTLCGLPPYATSILEGGSVATLAVDPQGNFYHPDFFNNRVLRYNDPFSTDQIADFVWGQPDFVHRECNQGSAAPNNKSICLTDWGRGGVSVESNGNLWVADVNNNRVLRFPYNSTKGAPDSVADLVLGQQDFSTSYEGTALNQMIKPAAVRVDAKGVVYVLDGGDGSGTRGRLLVFFPPLSNGMNAGQVFTGLGSYPTGIELDPSGDLWINNSENNNILRLSAGQITQVIPWVDSGSWGGIGIDRDKALMTGGWVNQEIFIYRPPSYPYWSDTFLKGEYYGAWNQMGPRGLATAQGLEVTDDQLIVSDGLRLLFWNHPMQLASNYPPADGVIGQPDLYSRNGDYPIFGRMHADLQHNKLWVVRGGQIQAYQLPLVSLAEPVINIPSPLPVKGGGSFAWSQGLHLTGIEYQSNCDCLWLSDNLYNRAFRISHINSADRQVDIILGQDSETGIHCNEGRDPDEGVPLYPTQDSLCHPGGLAFDRRGNLYVSDHNLEFAGNFRMLEFNSADLPPNPTSAIKGLPARRVYGRNGSFTEPKCQDGDPMCGPWEPVFSLNNDMVIGFNGYLSTHFPQIYHDPLTNTMPYASLMDFYSHGYAARRDSLGNLYMLDLTRSRVLIYKEITHTISGNAGLGNASITYTNEGSRTITAAADGSYAITIPDHWSGTVTPSFQCFAFSPAKLSYTNVTGDKTSQNFSASSTIPCISSIVPSDGPVTYKNSVNFTITFTESVTGVDKNDFTLITTGVVGAVITNVSGSGATYTVSINTGEGNGTIQLNVPASASIQDLTGNPLGNLPYTGSQIYRIIKTPNFGDVPLEYWAWSYIERLYSAGITGGCTLSPLNYCPGNVVTRAQMAIFLLKAEHGNSYTPPVAIGKFSDVPKTDLTAPWIEQLANEGITGGCGNGKYCPGDPVTRAQMAIFLLRAEHGATYTPPAATGMFLDVPKTDFTAPFIEQLAKEGITGGCGGGNYCPGKAVTRDQMAIFLVRAFNLP